MSPTLSSAAIAFICAMPMELEPLTRKLDLTEELIGDLRVHVGALGDLGVVGVVTGMGTALATEGTTRLLEAVEVDRVVVVGITGAVDDITPIGTLILPELVVDAATGAEHRPAQLGEGIPSGKMWTTDTLTTDLDVIAGLRAQGVVSLDMETAAIAELCEQRGIPWSVFRVISDRATDGTITEEVFRLSNLDGTPNNEAIERYFAEHPESISTMATLAEYASLATDAAAEAAIRACSTI
jgi:nucleoside phosphorylase